jgi:hypothetical protein
MCLIGFWDYAAEESIFPNISANVTDAIFMLDEIGVLHTDLAGKCVG